MCVCVFVSNKIDLTHTLLRLNLTNALKPLVSLIITGCDPLKTPINQSWCLVSLVLFAFLADMGYFKHPSVAAHPVILPYKRREQ